MEDRAFKGIWIPKEIWLNTDMTMMEKLFYIEIDSLDGEEGCFAKNDHFSSFFGISISRASEIINSLVKKELISITLIYYPGTKQVHKRILKINKDKILIQREIKRKKVRPIPSENRRPLPVKTEDPPSEKAKDTNNTIINNTITTTKENPLLKTGSSSLEILKDFSFSQKTLRNIIKELNANKSITETEFNSILKKYKAGDKTPGWIIDQLRNIDEYRKTPKTVPSKATSSVEKTKKYLEEQQREKDKIIANDTGESKLDPLMQELIEKYEAMGMTKGKAIIKAGQEYAVLEKRRANER